MGYCIELEKISIDEYRKRLESAYLPPERMILKEKTDERFGYFKNSGIKNVHLDYWKSLKLAIIIRFNNFITKFVCSYL